MGALGFQNDSELLGLCSGQFSVLSQPDRSQTDQNDDQDMNNVSQKSHMASQSQRERSNAGSGKADGIEL